MLLIAAGSTLMFIFGKIREAMFISMQKKLKKSSRLRPGTAVGHQTINQELHDLRRDLEAVRVCVHQFHNGDNFMLSNHSWKVSLTHEALDPVARPTYRESQCLPISHMTEMVGPVVEPELPVKGFEIWYRSEDRQKHVLFYTIDAMDVCASKILAAEQGVVFAVVINLVDPEKKATFGYISVHFQECDADRREELHAKLSTLQETAARIQFYLSDDLRSFDRPGWLGRLWRFLFAA